MRKKMFENIDTSVILEANWQCSSLMDLIVAAFPGSKVVYVVRDPRSWICSWMSMERTAYSWRDLRSWFKNARLTPYHFEGDPSRHSWKRMTVFEKLCWLWAKENSYALECAERSDAIRIFRYEDLFSKMGNYETMGEMLEFITKFPCGFKAEWSLKPELLEQKVNSRNGTFPGWNKWSDDQAKLLDTHCRPLMEKFGYGGEPEWQGKLV